MENSIEEDIEILRRIDIKFFLCGMIEQNNYIVDEADKVNNAIETVLNLLENQKAEIEEKDKQFKLLKSGISVQKVKDKIEEYKNMLKTCNKAQDIDRIKAINERVLELQELLGSEE